jgi:hypothetical protein
MMANHSSSTHLAGRDDVATAVRPITAGYKAAAFRSTRAGPKLDDRTLLHELWLISHFGWIAEALILRSLMIASGHELAPAALAERLGQLRQLGWLQERHRDAGEGRREWRLTDSGRNAV